ncbi:MAG: alpha/beta hydrolase [Arenimonas sp.]|nr:alpha/beta hydrolase [Arenimonas sp.]
MTPRPQALRCNASMGLVRALLLMLLLAGPTLADAAPFANSRFETIAGVKVHVRHWPAGPIATGCPVLLVHGFAGSTYSFRELAPALAAAGHEVWALDLPVYGYSERRPFPGTAGDALMPWLRAQGRGWCLLGHSMGTRVVGELARRMPQELHAVVYVAGNPILSPKELRSRERYKSPRIRRFLAALAESRYLSEPARVGDLLSKAYGRKATDAEIRGYLTPLSPPGSALAIMNGYSAVWPPNPTGEQLQGVPSLILWGEEDAWVKPDVADRLQAALPQATRVTIPGAGHLPMETHPGPTRDAVLTHFRRPPRTVSE